MAGSLVVGCVLNISCQAGRSSPGLALGSNFVSSRTFFADMLRLRRLGLLHLVRSTFRVMKTLSKVQMLLYFFQRVHWTEGAVAVGPSVAVPLRVFPACRFVSRARACCLRVHEIVVLPR